MSVEGRQQLVDYVQHDLEKEDKKNANKELTKKKYASVKR